MYRVVLGPPGTGKTTHLVGLLPDFKGRKVTFCSHTKAAAQATLERAGGKPDGVNIQTLHSIAFGKLSMSRAQVVDDKKLAEFAETMGTSTNAGDDGAKFMGIISQARAQLVDPLRKWAEHDEHLGQFKQFKTFALSYEAWKRAHGFMDFSDMLESAWKLKYRGDIEVLVVDEAQDLSPAAWKLIDQIAFTTGCDIVVAGDDDQAIFGFSGADPHGIERFAHRYLARVEVLPQSYRVPRTIHAVAEDIAGRMQHRTAKSYLPRDAEGEVKRWGDLDPLPYEVREGVNSMVLASDRWLRREAEDLLFQHRIPYTTSGGRPSPLQTRAGQALQTALLEDVEDTDVRSRIYRGLSRAGTMLWDSVGWEEAIKKVQNRDSEMLLHSHYDPEYDDDMFSYLREVKIDGHAVSVSTIHAAKGLEAEDVHLFTGLSRSALDQQWLDPDSLHRLFYVAVTRARENLHVYDTGEGYTV